MEVLDKASLLLALKGQCNQGNINLVSGQDIALTDENEKMVVSSLHIKGLQNFTIPLQRWVKYFLIHSLIT